MIATNFAAWGIVIIQPDKKNMIKPLLMFVGRA
jgi:hypothetical protein